MSENNSNMDEIRAKRLARLAGNATNPAASSTSSSSSSSFAPPSASSSSSSASSSSAAAALSPANSMKTNTLSNDDMGSPMKVDSPRKPAIGSDDLAKTVTKAEKSSTSAMDIDAKPSPQKATDSSNVGTADWDHSAISRIFEVTMNSSEKGRFFFMETLATEIEMDTASSSSSQFSGPHFNSDHLDRIFLDRISAFSGEPFKVLPYLFATFQRADTELRRLHPNTPKSRNDLMLEIMNLTVSYSGIYLQHPESLVTLPQNFKSSSLFDIFAQHLVGEPDTSGGLPSAFMPLFIQRFESDKEDFNALFTPLLSSMSQAMRRTTIADPFLPQVSVLVDLANYKSICDAIVSHPDFIPNVENGQQFEAKALLAPYFALSLFPDARTPNWVPEADRQRLRMERQQQQTIQYLMQGLQRGRQGAPPAAPVLNGGDDANAEPPIYTRFFTDTTRVTYREVQDTNASVRNALHSLHEKLHALMHSLLKQKEDREKVLTFMGRVIMLNSKRAQLHSNFDLHATDGFFLNFIAVMLRLCDKFINPLNPMLNKIDGNYLSHPDCRIPIKDETKLCASSEEVARWVDVRNLARQQAFINAQKQLVVDKSTSITEFIAPNFITECFFLTVATFHVSVISTIGKVGQLHKKSSELDSAIKDIEAQRLVWGSTPLAPRYEATLKEYKKKFEELALQRLAFETMLLDEQLLQHMLQFYEFHSQWLINMVDSESKGLPLADTVPEAFASLPEYYVEDVADLLIFVTKMKPSVLDGVSLDNIMRFIIIFIYSISYIRNPYLRAKLVEVITCFTPEMQGHNRSTRFGTLIERHPLSIQFLTPALMRFYVDVENTGSHTQFYDKFNIRYNIAIIFKNLWSSPDHRRQLSEESRTGEYFVRFANMIMNDLTFLLDESLEKLTQIREYERDKENMEQWNTQAQDVRQTRDATFAQNEKMVRTFLIFGRETLNMFHYLTVDIVEPFLRPEIIDRLAAMMDDNLVKLSGPKSQTLKVKNADKYSWNPRRLIVQLVEIFLHLAPEDDKGQAQMDFIQAVARDGRSYDENVFRNAVQIMEKHALAPIDTIAQFDRFVNLVQQSKKEGEDEEDELGEVPEEFQDPLLFTLMRDPVLLPTSNLSVDRGTIVSHLLSDSTDPFNRKYLTLDMIRPNVELKQKIDEWIKSKKTAGKN